METDTKIYIACHNKTFTFAARELSAYVRKMTGRRLPIVPATERNSRRHGYLIRCGDTEQRLTESDEFDIRTEKGIVVLSGNRPRSCLYAVYAYLEAQGVRFLRPGPGGEVVPKRRKLKTGIRLHEKASHDHRLICIEGAVSIEHACAVVDWMAKQRMNEFQVQFESSACFWNRWYRHELNPRYGINNKAGQKKRHRKLSKVEAKKLDDLLVREIKKRDIDLHLMGHGWTTRALGVTATDWKPIRRPVPANKKNWVALVDGKRHWHRGVPLNTELCYSNKAVFNAMVGCVVDYAESHPEADALLFSLSDGTNNVCQCSGCAKYSPSDWYVKLINSISESLDARSLKTKVSFTAYHHTMLAPEVEWINVKSKNLIFKYSPFYRCFEHALTDSQCSSDYPMDNITGPDLPVPVSARANTQLLRKWQARNSADGFMGTYHFYQLLYLVLDEMFVAKRIHTDTVDLLQLGFNGLFSCQVLRAFYPTGLGMTIMAKTLWDRNQVFDKTVDDYLRASFGPHRTAVKRYLEQVSSVLKPTSDGHDHLLLWAKDSNQARTALAYLAKADMKLRAMLALAKDPVHVQSLDYLVHYNKLLSFVCQAVERYAIGDWDGAQSQLNEATQFACDTEQDTQWVLDTWKVNHCHTERIKRWTGGPKWFQMDETH